MKLNGRIIQAISGFYYVEAADAVFECKARGSFRNKKIQPLVGDIVEIEAAGDSGTIISIADRKSCMARPAVANIDRLFIVASLDKPKPNLFIIDKLSALAVFSKIEPVIVFSKSDLADPAEYVSVYAKTGIKTLVCSAVNGDGTDELRELVQGHICAFSGNSGVGKSSLLNVLLPELKLETSEISEKLGRGRHTTRIVSLYSYSGGYIADTPGFSSFDFEEQKGRIPTQELPLCFPEFLPFIDNCRFQTSCSHTCDKGCAVLAAVNDGIIPPQRYESYCRMLAEAKKIKPWE